MATRTRTGRTAWGASLLVCGALLVVAQRELDHDEQRTWGLVQERAHVVAAILAPAVVGRDLAQPLPSSSDRAVMATIGGVGSADPRIVAIRLWSPRGGLVAAADGDLAAASDPGAGFVDALAGRTETVRAQGLDRTFAPVLDPEGDVVAALEIVERSGARAAPWDDLRLWFAAMTGIATAGLAATLARRPVGATPTSPGSGDREDLPRERARRGGAIHPSPAERGEGRAPDRVDVEGEAPPAGGELETLRAALERARSAQREAEARLRSAELELGILREERQTEPAQRIRELREALRRSESAVAQMAERVRWLSAPDDDDPRIAALREPLRGEPREDPSGDRGPASRRI